MAFLRIFSREHFLRRLHDVRHVSTIPEVIKLSEEVQQAKADRRPILALESTIITHGMPYPQNLETAIQVEQIVKEQGATPATIAILKGQLTVGLTDEQLKYLATAKDVVKTSRRDMAPVMAAKLDGATTVAGTIIAAELADIPVFATGGIGGVHREGESSLDVSADLTELGRCRTLVVCSGVKSILDICRTLEYLETQGVCVCSFGDSHEFPAFYTIKSGHRAPYKVITAEDAARLLQHSRILQLSSGIVVAVPVPQEYAMDEKVIEVAIEKALEEAKEKGIHGKEVTPYILAAVVKATSGTSLKTNIALIKNNAKVGADIAVEFNKLKNSKNIVRNGISTENLSNSTAHGRNTRGIHTSCRAHVPFLGMNKDIENSDKNTRANSVEVVVIGGANVDRTYRVTEDKIKLDGSTHACKGVQCSGGVGRNIGEALWRLRGPNSVRLITAIGDDTDGSYLNNLTPELIVKSSIIKDGRTPTYAAVFDCKGECALGLGDMTLHREISPTMINSNMTLLKEASLVVIDGNPPLETIEYVLKVCEDLKKPVFFEPTDRRKATKPFINKHFISFATPNRSELYAIAKILQPNLKLHQNLINIEETLEICNIVSHHVQCIILTIGEKGVIIIRRHDKDLKGRLYPVKEVNNLKNVSGAGDSFASGFIDGLLEGYAEEYCVARGFCAAHDALQSDTTVPKKFNKFNIEKAEYTIL